MCIDIFLKEQQISNTFDVLDVLGWSKMHLSNLLMPYIHIRFNNVSDLVNRFHFEMTICFMGIELF